MSFFALAIMSGCAQQRSVVTQARPRAPVVAPAPVADPSVPAAAPALPQYEIPGIRIQDGGTAAVQQPVQTVVPASPAAVEPPAAPVLPPVLHRSELSLQGILGELLGLQRYFEPSFMAESDPHGGYLGDAQLQDPLRHSVGSACVGLAGMAARAEGLVRVSRILMRTLESNSGPSPIPLAEQFMNQVQQWFVGYCGADSEQFGNRGFYITQYARLFGQQREGASSRTSPFGALVRAYSNARFAFNADTLSDAIVSEVAAERAYLASREGVDSETRDYAYATEKASGARAIQRLLRNAAASPR